MKTSIAFQLQKSISVQMYMCATLTSDIMHAFALRSCRTTFALSIHPQLLQNSIHPQHSPLALAEQHSPSTFTLSSCRTSFTLSIRPHLLQNSIRPQRSPSALAEQHLPSALAKWQVITAGPSSYSRVDSNWVFLVNSIGLC